MKYKNVKKTIFSSFVAIASLVFAGCVSSKQEVEIPQWYLNSPANTSLFLYGSGEGENLEAAKSNALNNMASGLVVSISSSLQTTTKTSVLNGKDSYSKDVSKDVKVEVQKIKFTNATVKNTQLIDGKFYVLMQVNRVDLFTQKKAEFDTRDNRIDELYGSLDGKSKLSQVHTLQDIYPMIKEAKAQTIVLNAINNEFSYATYTKKYDKYIDKIDDIKQTCIVNVETSIQEKYFADHIVDMLNLNKFKISNNSSKSDISIKINVQPKYSMTNGWNIAKVTTAISVISEEKIVSNKIISTVGRSSTSQESALEDASKRFREELENATLDKIIFGK